ncbi:MAG: ATP-binding protein [Desulfurococcales archaeon]|nr:ATP-binding protein [Desulfurococcales archaeon]
MSKTIKRIKAVIPYAPPGIKTDYLKIDIELDKLTVLIGPNASGKTTILESLGYILSSMLKPLPSALGLALTATLRPRRRVPSSLAGVVFLDNTSVVSTFLEPDPLLFFARNYIEEMLSSIDHNTVIILDEIKRDLDTYSDILSELGSTSNKHKKINYRILNEIVTNILGKRIDLAVSNHLRGTNLLRIESGEDEEIINLLETSNIIKRFIYLSPKMRFIYTLVDDKIMKAILLRIPSTTIVIKKQDSQTIEAPNVMVFHPGFIYWYGIFEGLYYTSVREGLPNEKEAINLLKKYIKWIEGYELIGRVLHVKSHEGKRISVYNLSDGQRVAVFISLLYAISKPPVLFLLDTPEAFVHPDGLPVVADFITRLVASGNQVVIATQSIEFLRKLLDKAKEDNILDNTLVERIELTKNGLIKAKGKWSGKVSLQSIESLGLDLRK